MLLYIVLTACNLHIAMRQERCRGATHGIFKCQKVGQKALLQKLG